MLCLFPKDIDYISLIIFIIMPKPLRKSASLFLCLESQKPEDSNIIMLKRLGSMSFGNLYASPGGVCDPEDIDASP